MTFFEWREAPEGDFAVIGDPVGHSFSPEMHEWAWREAGGGCVYRRIRVVQGEVGLALDHLVKMGYRGVNVTVPLKEEARGWCAQSESEAAVNTIRLGTREGFSTDEAGFRRLMGVAGVGAGARVMVLGTGATARLAVRELRAIGAVVTVWGRNRAAVEGLGSAWRERVDLAGMTAVVDGTSAGLHGADLPVDWGSAAAECVAVSLSYGVGAERFLGAARRSGLRGMDGLVMLAGQGAEAYRLFGGRGDGLGAMLCALTRRGLAQAGVEELIWESAGRALGRGELVVLPTETVYGLGADALNADAVERIFAVKGRPAGNPLIVHVEGGEDVHQVVREWPETADRLAKAFWPGPLTLVLPKQARVPEVVTAGLDTVGVRCPDHLVFREVLARFGGVIAAPSANVYTGLSPTRAGDVDERILREAWAVVDGGECRVGLESTVVDLSEGEVRILRPGTVTREAIEAVLGVRVAQGTGAGPAKSPGLAAKHYSPGVPVRVVERVGEEAFGIRRAGEASDRLVVLPDEAEGFGRGLYAALRELERRGAGLIEIEWVPDTEAWAAVRDRLSRM